MIPALETGDPFTLNEGGTAQALFVAWPGITAQSDNSGVFPTLSQKVNVTASISIDDFSDRAIIANTTNMIGTTALIIDLNTTASDLKATISDDDGGDFNGFNYFNVDLRSFSTTQTFDIFLLNTTSVDGVINSAGSMVSTTTIGMTGIADDVDPQSLTLFNDTVNDSIFDSLTTTPDANEVGLLIVTSDNSTFQGVDTATSHPIVAASHLVSMMMVYNPLKGLQTK